MCRNDFKCPKCRKLRDCRPYGLAAKEKYVTFIDITDNLYLNIYSIYSSFNLKVAWEPIVTIHLYGTLGYTHTKRQQWQLPMEVDGDA